MVGAGREVKGDDGDVIILTEMLSCVGDITGRFVADLLSAFEAEEFATRVGGLYDSIGEEYKPVAELEPKIGLFIRDARGDAEGEARCKLHLATIAVRAEVASVGDRHGAVGIDSRT